MYIILLLEVDMRKAEEILTAVTELFSRSTAATGIEVQDLAHELAIFLNESYHKSMPHSSEDTKQLEYAVDALSLLLQQAEKPFMIIEILRHLGLAYQMQKKYDGMGEAIDRYERALLLMNHNNIVDNSMSISINTHLAEVYYAKSDIKATVLHYRNALDLYKKMHEADPMNPVIKAHYADMLYRISSVLKTHSQSIPRELELAYNIYQHLCNDLRDKHVNESLLHVCQKRLELISNERNSSVFNKPVSSSKQSSMSAFWSRLMGGKKIENSVSSSQDQKNTIANKSTI